MWPYYSRGGGTLRAGSGSQGDGEFGAGIHSVHVLADWCGRHKLRHRHVGHDPHHELNKATVLVSLRYSHRRVAHNPLHKLNKATVLVLLRYSHRPTTHAMN